MRREIGEEQNRKEGRKEGKDANTYVPRSHRHPLSKIARGHRDFAWKDRQEGVAARGIARSPQLPPFFQLRIQKVCNALRRIGEKFENGISPISGKFRRES